MTMTYIHSTEHEFVLSYMDKWGEDAVDYLLAKGFKPVLTTDGWKWLHVDNDD